MLIKYGKASNDIIDITKRYVLNNKDLLEDQDRISDIYKKRPLRSHCKVCDGNITEEGNIFSKFVSHGVEYAICKKCGHVNGKYDDDLEFSNLAYCNKEYAERYPEQERKEYEERVKRIYIPKAEFLKEVLLTEGAAGNVLDIGAGAGYFCSAAKMLDMDIRGVEITEQQVEYANKILGNEVIKQINPDELIDNIRNTTCNVVSAIGVLEHIYNLRDILQAIKDNKNIKYFYFSIPLFSFSVFLETAFEHTYNRQLGGPHTHLFSRESINYMNDEFGFEVVGEWNFGTDIVDLYRLLSLSLKEQGIEYTNIFESKFISCIDEMQEILDKHDFASEIHMVVKSK